VGTLADATSASLRRQLGEDRLVQLVRDGEGLRLGEAIELALEALR
jgi:hypothetical protein